MYTPAGLSQATDTLKSLLESKPDYLPGLIAQAQLQLVARNRDQFLVAMQAVESNLSQANSLSFEERVNLCSELVWEGARNRQSNVLIPQIRACIDAANETKLRHLTVEQLADFLAVTYYLPDHTTAEQQSIDLASKLWSTLQRTIKQPFQ